MPTDKNEILLANSLDMLPYRFGNNNMDKFCNSNMTLPIYPNANP